MKIGAAILFVATTSMLAQQPYQSRDPKDVGRVSTGGAGSTAPRPALLAGGCSC